LPTPPKQSSPRRVFRDDREAVAFWFDFAWVLADGMPAPFTVVDIAELTEDGLIAKPPHHLRHLSNPRGL
jgi:hypothetical protein